MSETLLLILKIVGIYLSGMGISYIVAAKVIGYDNMIGDEQWVANLLILLSWIGIAIALIGGVVYGFKLLLDFIFKINKT